MSSLDASAMPKPLRAMRWSCRKRRSLEIGDGGVREEDLARRETARCRGAGDAGGGAKESELESVLARRRVERAGDVPPLDARTGVGAEVARKDERPGATPCVQRRPAGPGTPREASARARARRDSTTQA